MSLTLRALSVILCVVPLAFAAEQPSNATGTLTVNGITTKLTHAYAFHDAGVEMTRVFVTPKALDADTLAGELPLHGSGGQSALRARVAKGELSAIELFITGDGSIDTVIIFDRAFDAPTPTSGDDLFWSEPYRMPGGWVGGRSRSKQEQEFFDHRWSYDVAYFAPVGEKAFVVPAPASVEAQRKEIEVRETPRIVPPGGGEEGKAYLAFFGNLESGNVNAALQQMTPAMLAAVADRMQVAKLAPTDLSLWAMSLTTPPGKVEIVGGVRDANGTRLELRRTTGSRVRFGTALMVREENGWKVAEQSW